MRFAEILREMGCRIVRDAQGIEVHGDHLHGIEIDMNDLPDCVPTLAVVAAFADGPTTITNVGHLRLKESDRLSALEAELPKLGAYVVALDDTLQIVPGTRKGAVIESYNDHRIAMSFAVAGLAVTGIAIRNPMCVTKSFPDFWDGFSRLEGAT
jgi:3-phosphoshikimate 1-carboxyvinyltransferase